MAVGGAIIGALRVVLGADAASLEKGLKGAQSKLASFGAGVAKHGAVAAAAFATIGTALGFAVKGAVNEADKLGKMAQSVGMPVEDLSRLKHVADLSGVSLEQLGKGVKNLGVDLVEIAGGGTNAASRALAALGISAIDSAGQLKTPLAVMTEVSGRLATMEDGAAKTAIAAALFGKKFGPDLIPALNMGSAAMREMMAEADALGIVIDTRTAKSAEAFNDNLTRLGKVKDGIVLQITARMLPAFENLSKMMIDVAKNGEGLKSFAEGLVFVLRSVTSVAIGLGTALVAVSTSLAGMIAAVILASQGQFTAALEALKSSWGDTVETFTSGAKLIADAWKEAGNELPAATKKIAAPIMETAAAVSKAASMAEAALKRILEAGKRTYEETRTPAEMFGMAIQRLNEQYEAGAISADTYARAVAKAQNEMVAANVHAQNLGSALETAFGRALEKGANFGDILKSLIIDFAKMEAMSGFRTLLHGAPGGGGGFLAKLFGGFKLPGFAMGGSFSVGGPGGIDSQLVAFRATPGEQVTVSKKNEGGAAGGQLTVRVSLDSELLRAVVTDEAGRVVGRAAPQIVNQATAASLRAIPAARRNNPNMFG